jgi:hypothetical protein
MSVWLALIPLILQLIELLLPLFSNRVRRLQAALAKNKTAKKIMIEANPTTFDEFLIAYNLCLMQTIEDMKPTKKMREKYDQARLKLMGDKMAAGTWNLICQKTGLGEPTTEYKLSEIMDELKKDTEE